MGARLVDAQGREFGIPAEQAVVVGRLAGCAVAISEPSVSREHAKIYVRDGSYFLVDLNSANGTFVNGKRITRAELSSEDEITFGTARLVFRTEIPAAPPGEASPEPVREPPPDPVAIARESSGFTLADDPFAGDADVARAESEVTFKVDQPVRGRPSQPTITTRDDILQYRAKPRSARGGLLGEDLQQRPLSFQLMLLVLGLGVAALLFFGVKSVIGKLMPSGEDSAPATSDGNR